MQLRESLRYYLLHYNLLHHHLLAVVDVEASLGGLVGEAAALQVVPVVIVVCLGTEDGGAQVDKALEFAVGPDVLVLFLRGTTGVEPTDCREHLAGGEVEQCCQAVKIIFCHEKWFLYDCKGKNNK